MKICTFINVKTWSSTYTYDAILQSGTINSYRYGFNGMEKDDEVKGSGNSYDFGARMYDSRLGRWLSLDKVQHPHASPYNSMDNNPILKIDPDGKDAIVTVNKNENGGGTITISSTFHVVGNNITQNQLNQSKSDFDAFVKNGTYIDVEGKCWDIVYDVTFVSAGNVNAQELRESIPKGDNVVDLNSGGHTEGALVLMKSKPYGAPDSELKVNDAYQETSNIAHVGSLENSSVVNHEILHLLGLADRYSNVRKTVEFDNGTSVSRLVSFPEKGWSNDIMSSTFGGENFGQSHFDNYGRAYSDKMEGSYLLEYNVDINQTNGDKIGGDSSGLSENEKNETSKTASKPRFE